MIAVNGHPCFSEQAHRCFGRLHIPCAPRCNLDCAFCGRGLDGGSAQLPGRAERIVAPQEAERYVSERLAAHPEITVLGIAGPGEPLANPETFEVLKLLHSRFPERMLCLGTNGSLLPSAAQRLWSLGVRTLTVTVNALDPEIAAFLTPYADGPHDLTAARRLIRRQLEGVRRCAALGMIVKVNTVLVPNVNESELRPIAEAVRERGAVLQNVMPLHPAGRLRNAEAPSPAHLHALREELSGILPQMRHCAQCRADACGLLGQEPGGGCIK